MVDGQIVRPEPAPRPHSRRVDVGWKESRYASPLPSPDDLERYKQLLPDAPERLLASGEKEQAHRHQAENRLIALDEEAMPKFYEGQRRGHAISLVLGGGYLTIMLVAVLKGYALEGVIGAAAGIAGMIWAIRRDTRGPQVERAPEPPPDESDEPPQGDRQDDE